MYLNTYLHNYAFICILHPSLIYLSPSLALLALIPTANRQVSDGGRMLFRQGVIKCFSGNDVTHEQSQNEVREGAMRTQREKYPRHRAQEAQRQVAVRWVLQGGPLGQKRVRMASQGIRPQRLEGVMVQVTQGLEDHGKDLEIYFECSERPLEDHILIRLLEGLGDTVSSCKQDFPVSYLPPSLWKIVLPSPSYRENSCALQPLIVQFWAAEQLAERGKT